MADVLHSAQTAADGNHVQQRWVVADATARLALSVTPADVGGACLQLSPLEIYDLLDDSPMTWLRRGDVAGPASSTDNRLARYSGTTGKLIDESALVVDDSGNVSGVGNITLSGTVDGRDVSADGTTLDGHTTTIAAKAGTTHSALGTVTTAASVDAQSGVTVSASMTLTNSTTAAISVSNIPASGSLYHLRLGITQSAGGTGLITYPSGTKHVGGTAMPLSVTASAVDIRILETRDGGTTWYCYVGGNGFA
jgi:hypothetical protein